MPEPIILFIIIVALIAITVFILKRYNYNKIDSLNESKVNLFEDSIDEDYLKASRLNMSGEYQAQYQDLVKEWDDVQTDHFPLIENYLYDAEKSTDKWKFIQASHKMEEAEDEIEFIESEMDRLSNRIENFMIYETENSKRVQLLKKQYEAVRKKLLTHSFSFEPAIAALEEKLSIIENQFHDFFETSQRGNHVKGEMILEELEKKIKDIKEDINIIPQLLERIDDFLRLDLEDIETGYKELKDMRLSFEDDTILEDVENLHESLDTAKDEIEKLELEEANHRIDQIDDHINDLFGEIEEEYQAYQNVKKDIGRLRSAFNYLNEKNHKIKIETDRLSQSYFLTDEVLSFGGQNEEDVKKLKAHYEKVVSNLNNSEVIYSKADQSINDVFDKAKSLYELQNDFLESLTSLPDEEQEIKDSVNQYVSDMRVMKREMEKLNLPGVKKQYQDLYDYTTSEIKGIATQLNRLRLDIRLVRELDNEIQQLVAELKSITNQHIHDVSMIDELLPFLNQNLEEDPELREAIKTSEYYFGIEHDYEKSYETLKDIVEEIAPGHIEEVEEKLNVDYIK